MKLPEHGTVAIDEIDESILDNFELSNLTAHEAYDITAIYNRLSERLTLLEKFAEGTDENLKELNSDYIQLPEQSEERLEIDVRIRALKRKWGIFQRAKKRDNSEFTFPVSVNRLNEFTISNKYAPYINAGKEGRAWVDNWIIEQGVTMIKDQETAFHLVDEAVQQLEQLMEKLQSVQNQNEWIAVLEELQITVDKNAVQSIYQIWINTELQEFRRLGLFKKWITEQEEKVLLNQGSMEVIEGKVIDKFIKSDE
ncbi:hypothetical protein [Indiicoccus explosivorum]|uniref:hypothetical protein n=1 Tax=Indiicoccus explosivorum TaxID=1917864 RepID=UPI000B44EA5B|nr:hypothetical protein [Indiicoccus explosivorum]